MYTCYRMCLQHSHCAPDLWPKPEQYHHKYLWWFGLVVKLPQKSPQVFVVISTCGAKHHKNHHTGWKSPQGLLSVMHYRNFNCRQRRCGTRGVFRKSTGLVLRVFEGRTHSTPLSWRSIVANAGTSLGGMPDYVQNVKAQAWLTSATTRTTLYETVPFRSPGWERPTVASQSVYSRYI